MLRILYLAGLWKCQGGSWSVLCCGWFKRFDCSCCCPCVDTLSKEDCPPEETKGSWTTRGLKRQLVKRAITPAVAVSSVVADIDVATDWYYWQSDDIQDGAAGVAWAAFLFALLGTFSWLMLATDCLGWLRVSSYFRDDATCSCPSCCCCFSSSSSFSPASPHPSSSSSFSSCCSCWLRVRSYFGRLASCCCLSSSSYTSLSRPSSPPLSSSTSFLSPSSPPTPTPLPFSSSTASTASSSCLSCCCADALHYLPLINTVMEDLPQLVITFLTSGYQTVPGALNIIAAVFGFLAKVAEAYAAGGHDLPADFAAVSDDATCPLVIKRLEFEDRIAEQTAAFKDAADTIVVANHHPDYKSSMLGVFRVARNQSAFVCYAANVRVISLNGVDLGGSIPTELGTLPNLTELTLVSCGLTGSIPAELGNLINLTVLNLGWNKLKGPIPPELVRLINLQELDLYHNSLTGIIPPELSQLPRLRVLNLHGNAFTGEVPPLLSDRPARPDDGLGINTGTTTTYGTYTATPHHEAGEIVSGAVPPSGQRPAASSNGSDPPPGNMEEKHL